MPASSVHFSPPNRPTRAGFANQRFDELRMTPDHAARRELVYRACFGLAGAGVSLVAISKKAISDQPEIHRIGMTCASA
jgi:hypothetical protein